MSVEHVNSGIPCPDTTIENSFETKVITKAGNSDTDSICHLFESCLRKYGTVLVAFQTDTLRSKHLVIDPISEVKDEFSRLRIWGEQTYAVLPQNARRSLDEQLREDEDTKQIVIRCLQRLNSYIEKAIEQTRTNPLTTDVDTEEEDYSSLSDASDAAQEGLETAWEIRFRKTINSIFEGVRSLYRVSVLLRRPKNSSKYLRSSNSMIPSHDALRVTLDYAHVSEKIRQWRHLTMRSRVGEDEEHAVTEEEIQLRKENEQQEIADITFFCQRLTWANTFRRKQFVYWIDYPDVPETQTRASDVVDQANKGKDKTMSAIPTSLSTVAKSALGDNTEVRQWRTVYAKSAVGRSNTTRVPEVPKCSRADPNFECPFCHIILNSKSMQKRETWKKHVFRDLRPYVCSFEKCPDPGRLFITRHDWIYHEQQMHRRRWTCPHGCAKDLPSKTDMVQHMLVAHSNNIDKRQVSTYADMCEREMKDTSIDACLICSEEMSLSRLYEHLATHMEEIALFVLPMNPDEEEDEHIDEITEEKSQYTEDTESASAKRGPEEDAAAEHARVNDERERKLAADLRAVTDAEAASRLKLELQAREEQERECKAYDDFLRKQREKEAAEEQAYRAEATFKVKLELDVREELEREAYEDFLIEQRKKEEAEQKAFREALRKQKEKEETGGMKYQAFLYEQEEIREAEEKAKKEEQARIDSAMRARLEKAGYSAKEIDILLNPEDDSVERARLEKTDRSQGDTDILLDTEEHAGGTSLVNHVPVYPRVNRKFLDIETLDYYHVPWEFDRANPEYFILLRELDKYETDVLFEHTRRRRQEREGAVLTDLGPVEADYTVDKFNEAQPVVETKDETETSLSHLTSEYVKDPKEEPEHALSIQEHPSQEHVSQVTQLPLFQPLADQASASSKSPQMSTLDRYAQRDERSGTSGSRNPQRDAISDNNFTRAQKHPATFQCTLCPKKFTRAYNLRSHLRTHTDDRPFVCTVCGKRFARQHDCKRHENLHSSQNEGGPQHEAQL